MREYRIELFIRKLDGFIPVNELARYIEERGGEHKYSALLENNEAINKYALYVILPFDTSVIYKYIGGMSTILKSKIVKV